MLVPLLMMAAVPSAVAERPQLELDSEDRRALLAGIRTRVGGHFIITGLDRAEATCARLRTCVTGDVLLERARSDAVLSGAENVAELVDRTRVFNLKPAALVSVRGARYLPRLAADIEVRLSVFDPATGRWSGKLAVLSGVNSAPGSNSGAAPAVRKLFSWSDVVR